MSGLRFAVEGRSLIAVAHLASLGVKVAGTAFWDINNKSKKEWFIHSFFVMAGIYKKLSAKAL